MKNIVEAARNVNEFGDVMVIEFEFLQFEQVFNVLEITRDEVVHAHHIKSFFDETIAQMRPKKTSSASNKNSFICHCLEIKCVDYGQCFHNGSQVH